MARRTSESEMLLWAFLLLFVLPAAMGAAVAATTQMITLGFLGGVWRRWYASYSGMTYFALAGKALPALASIAATVNRGAASVARNELDRWLDVYDPLGVVRGAIEADDIEDSPIIELYLER